MTFKKLTITTNLLVLFFTLWGCKVNYNFSGGNVGTAETFQVNFFQNLASESPGSTIEAGLDRDFTNELQDLLSGQTSLTLVSNNADLTYEGEIVEYRIAPMTATADQTAAQNRLTMRVNVRFFNKTKEGEDFEKGFSHFFDFDATTQLNAVKSEAHAEIFNRIMQNIFNESLANW